MNQIEVYYIFWAVVGVIYVTLQMFQLHERIRTRKEIQKLLKWVKDREVKIDSVFKLGR